MRIRGRCEAADRRAVVISGSGAKTEKKKGVWSSGGKKRPRSVKGGRSGRHQIHQVLHPGLQQRQEQGRLGKRLENEKIGLRSGSADIRKGSGSLESGGAQGLEEGIAKLCPCAESCPSQAGVPGWVRSKRPVLPAPQPGSPGSSHLDLAPQPQRLGSGCLGFGPGTCIRKSASALQDSCPARQSSALRYNTPQHGAGNLPLVLLSGLVPAFQVQLPLPHRVQELEGTSSGHDQSCSFSP